MGAIIAALIAAAGGIISGVMMNKETEKAQQEARAISNRDREDSLFLNGENLKLSKAQHELNKKQVAYARDAELYGRGERGLERGMAARENNFAKSLALVNSNDALRTSFLNNWTRRKV